MMFRIFLVLFLLPASLRADPGQMCSSGEWDHVQCIRPEHFVHDTCQAIEYFAGRHGLDEGFLARLLWQESRFDPNAVSHAKAHGIAQFIASTAKKRGLEDVFNPAEAIEHSAQYLGEMTRHYGNMGLAAVGYNGGERRANGLVAKTGGLARETINYVQIITGLTAETWRDTPPDAHDFRLDKDTDFQTACHTLSRKRRLTALKPPKPAISYAPWGVQLAFGDSEKKARAAFARKTRACSATVRGQKIDIIFVKNRVSGRKGFYMARLGRNDVKSANALCTTLRSQGCGCSVYKNKP